jgi:TM2 domain-containing membrane protein YozV
VEIYLEKTGEVTGPFTIDVVLQKLGRGEIDRETLGWSPVSKDWRPLRQIIILPAPNPECPAPVIPMVAAPAPQVVIVAAPEQGMSRAVYIILALFLGLLGIHNFAAGKTASGYFQLLLSLSGIFTCGLTTAVVLVWVFVEIIAVNRDGSGREFS